MPRRPKTASIDDVLGPAGLLARQLPTFQHREQQVEAARAVEDAFRSGRHALIEAGTGVGKTLAYLVPAVRAIADGKKVVVSTHTINLQAQLFEKDIPLVRSLFPGVDVKPALMKGRANYLCKQDLDAAEGDLFHLTDPLFLDIKRWARKTDSGDVAELPFSYGAWYEIAANQDTCRQKDCRYYDTCFYYEARRNAGASNLIVVNHALFLSDLQVRKEEAQGAILPPYDFVVIDEAHHLEDVATRVFGVEFGNRRIPHYVERVRRTKGLDVKGLSTLDRLNEELFSALESPRPDFFLKDLLHGEAEENHHAVAEQICATLEALQTDLLEAAKTEESAGMKERLQGLARIGSRMREELHMLAFHSDPDYIRWGHSTTSSGPAGRNHRVTNRTTLHYTPIGVGKLLNDLLWTSTSSVVLTSATLANSGGFGYVRDRLGLADPGFEKVLGSPFDFRSQALLYVPAGLPAPPKSPTPGYVEQAATEIERVVRMTEGRAFVLFTSRRMLNEVFALLERRLEYPLFKQGDMPPARLLEEFRDSGNGCLFGVQTFWEGVDVQGEALSCVIIDRLPFAVPDSPITRARTDAIAAAGGDWFNEFSIPQAQIRLKQGFGRLIRTQRDRGIVCILDSRLLSRNYGPEFVRFLPPASRASLWSRVERFWRGLAREPAEDSEQACRQAN